MRTYEHSIAALNLPGSRYQKMMLSQLPLRTLYQSYQMPLYMVVYDSYLNASMAIDMSAIKSDCEYRSITFDQYLIDTAGITLPYLDSLPALDTQYVRYADVFYAGYAINREHPEGYQTTTVTRDEKPWAKLTKPNIDYVRLYQTSLVTINGFFHRTDADSSGLYVVDAFKSLEISKRNAIGITNFSEVGDLSFKNFTTDIDFFNDEESMLNGSVLDFKEDVTNKVVMFVVGGYLYYNHPAFTRSSPSRFRVRFDLLDLPNRHYEMSRYIDTSSLGVEFDTTNPTMTMQSRLTSGDYIAKLMALSQSFAIVLNADSHIFYEQLPIQFDKRAPWAETYLIPDKPLITYNGRLLDYRWQYGWDDRYIVHVADHLVMRNIVNTTSNKQAPMDQSLDPNDPLPVGRASFLYLGKDI